MDDQPIVKRMTSLDRKIAASIQRGEDERKQHARRAQPMGGLTSIASTAGCNIANDPRKPQPPGGIDVPLAVASLQQAMRADPGLAWSWHCNIAMSFVDAERHEAEQGLPRTRASMEFIHRAANHAAARFMLSAFNVDTSARVKEMFPESNHSPVTPESALRDCVKAPEAPQGRYETLADATIRAIEEGLKRAKRGTLIVEPPLHRLVNEVPGVVCGWAVTAGEIWLNLRVPRADALNPHHYLVPGFRAPPKIERLYDVGENMVMVRVVYRPLVQ